MQSTAQTETSAERLLRDALDGMDVHYHVDLAPVPDCRSRADVVVVDSQVAVFVNGCFWHGCPDHGTWPRHNAEWWRAKIESNRERDARIDDVIRKAGWMVLRFWEHDDPIQAALVVAKVVRHRSRSPNAAESSEL
jgi:DNA mismatch endonuclease, patch repair protein